MKKIISVALLIIFSESLYAKDIYYSYWNYCEGYMYKFDFKSGIHKAYQYYQVEGKDRYIENEFKLEKVSKGVYLTGIKNAPRMYFDNNYKPIKIELEGQSVKFVEFDVCPALLVDKMMKGIGADK